MMDTTKGKRNPLRITRKEFVSALTSNQSIFAGIVRGNFDLEFTRATLHDEMEIIHRDGIFVNKRIAIARSHDLKFTGDSYLSLDNREFEKLECGNCTAYICVDTFQDGMYQTWEKRIVYVVE